MTIKKNKELIFENYYRRILFTRESSYYSMKHQKENHLLLLAIKVIKNT